MIWAISYLRDKIFTKFESYIAHYLKRGNVASYDLIMIKTVNTVKYYLKLFLQLFGDLDETKIAELRLLKLIQSVSIPEYLTKFIQYTSRVI
jgi:hypothetical protein